MIGRLGHSRITGKPIAAVFIKVDSFSNRIFLSNIMQPFNTDAGYLQEKILEVL